jgi:two-component system, LuxR family, response regulator DctR
MKRYLPHIVDDDAAVRDALAWLLQSHGIGSVQWGSGEEFLGSASTTDCGCLILDLRMPGMSGIELFDRLRKRGCELPVIFLTGHGDVPIAVQAIKDGAFDFLEKPVDESRLVDRVRAGLAAGQERSRRAHQREVFGKALEQLTVREREVMSCVLAGKLNKVIADELGIAMRTVEVHRARVFEKMGVRSAVELSQALATLGDEAARGITGAESDAGASGGLPG